jgi:hypothetical protein
MYIYIYKWEAITCFQHFQNSSMKPGKVYICFNLWSSTPKLTQFIEAL